MDNSKLKRFASHTVAVVVGLVIASQCQGPNKVSVVEKEVIKEVKVEVPVEKIVEKEVVVYKYKTKIEKVYVSGDTHVVKVIKHYSVVDKKHRISLYGGSAPSGNLAVTPFTGGYLVSTPRTAVFGVGYAYNLDSKYSVGFNAFSNQSYLVSIGRDL